jgi:hypothetical protein
MTRGLPQAQQRFENDIWLLPMPSVSILFNSIWR